MHLFVQSTLVLATIIFPVVSHIFLAIRHTQTFVLFNPLILFRCIIAATAAYVNSYLSLSEMTQDFGRFGITHHARFLALILIVVSALYIAGAKDLS